MGLLISSRGCPFGCSYCSSFIWGRRVRYRSIDNIVDEIKILSEKYGTQQYTFKDDSFTVNRKRVLEFCDKIRSQGIDIQLEYNARVDQVDDALLKRMKEAGCNGIKVGIESGSEGILALTNRRTTLNQAREAAKAFRRAGIHWTGYFMMLFPTESREEIYQTMRFMEELQRDFVSFSLYEPYPGTEMFKVGLGKGLVELERTLKDYYTINPKYLYFKDMNRRSDTIETKELKRIEKEFKDLVNKHNISLKNLLGRALARRRVYFRQPSTLRYDFKKFLAWMR